MINPFNFFKYLPHYLRKRFNEKYIIIESDDWGLERGVDKNSINWIEKKFGKENLSRWSYDALETREDLNMLYEVLDSYKSKFEAPPLITANFIMHNVDYSGDCKLNFIPLDAGFNEGSEDVRELYKTGIERKYIFPQLHGYSHYNITKLEKYFHTEEGKESFKNKFFTARATVRKNISFGHGELSKDNEHSGKIKEASEVFERYFGFSSASIIPPTFIFDTELMNTLKQSNIKLMQSTNRLMTSSKKRFNAPNFQKRNGMYWSVRNARLDPHAGYGFYHEQCLVSIDNAFKNRTPAVIDIHRVNFSGRFAPEYRNKTIFELRKLFDSIYGKWPDVKFIHTQQLSDILWQQETR